MPNFAYQPQGMGFQSYNPMVPNNLMRRAAQNAAEQAYIANWMNTPLQTGYDSPFLNFLTNTARVVKPYLPQRQKTEPTMVPVGPRG